MRTAGAGLISAMRSSWAGQSTTGCLSLGAERGDFVRCRGCDLALHPRRQRVVDTLGLAVARAVRRLGVAALWAAFERRRAIWKLAARSGQAMEPTPQVDRRRPRR